MRPHAGILIRDGMLNYRPERLAETYYSAQVGRHLAIALNYQVLAHPAHNRDRGPVSVYALRVHSEF